VPLSAPDFDDALPWLGTMLGFLILVTYIPEISLWLPRTLGMLN
jgi:C4-dicarboxylate transporter DctM subunit